MHEIDKTRQPLPPFPYNLPSSTQHLSCVHVQSTSPPSSTSVV